MNYTTLLCFVLLQVSVQAQEAEVIWTETPLTTTDFQSRDHAVSGEYARTSSRSTILGYIYSGISMDYELRENHLHLVVKALMKPKESWLLDATDVATLRHEQCHFDITELAARELRAELRGIKSVAAAEAAYERTMHRLKTDQKHFDRENREENGVSEEWLKYIHNELIRTVADAGQEIDTDLPRR